MPELAEVERAKNDCKLATEGKIIVECLTKEDKNVFQGCTHTEFANALRGKKINSVGRLGKYFYLVMQSAPHVVMHLGMAGFVATKGQSALFYRKKAKNTINEEGTDWPLRYWKFALEMEDGSSWCFCDSRRFGRISLVHSLEGNDKILELEPLSLLGRDPYLDMPTLEEFSALVVKRKAPIKAILLDQNGPLCGLGNWMVDEIFFQAAMHPAQRGNTLNKDQLQTLYDQIQHVTNTAVKVNANHSLFPSHWLFKYRWGKGRRDEPATFTLPDGTLATVIHQTIGGRTTAIVETVQKLIEEVGAVAPSDDGEEVDVVVKKQKKGPEDSASEQEEEKKVEIPTKRARKSKANVKVEGEEAETKPEPVSETIKPKKRAVRAKKVIKEEVEKTTADLQQPEVEEGHAQDAVPAVKISTRKRKAPQDLSESKQKVKTEVIIETPPVQALARRASTRKSH